MGFSEAGSTITMQSKMNEDESNDDFEPSGVS